MSEEQIGMDGDGLIDAILLVGANFDFFTPAAQALMEAGGMVPVYGTFAEMEKLRSRGITCHMPLADTFDGEGYLWMLTRKDYARAQKILGGRR